MSGTVAIRAESIGKRYRLARDARRHDTLRDVLAEGFHSFLRQGLRVSGEPKEFWALRDISFEINRGENVGIIGLNGAGKSTLLKILSRIVHPSSGRASVVGRLGALLEVGTGFHSELTGRENTYLYGSILGMRKQEIDRKFDGIVDFAGISAFVDTPVKRYSSGMYVRLAFAVAAHLEPDIMIIDEVLSVGDLPFQRKCMELTKKLQAAEATILFVSHNLFSIKSMCQRVIYLKQGEIVFDGPTDAGIALYENDCRLSNVDWLNNGQVEAPVRITDASLRGGDGLKKQVFELGEHIVIDIEYDVRHPIIDPNFIVAFVRSDGVACCNYSSELDGLSLGRIVSGNWLRLQTPPLKLTAGFYTIHIIVREPGFQQAYCAQIVGTFHVRDELLDGHFGVFHESAKWFSEHPEQTKRSPEIRLINCEGRRVSIPHLQSSCARGGGRDEVR